MRSGVSALTAEAAAGLISEVLREKYGGARHAAKRLARSVGADPRAVKNWLQGTTAPRLADAMKLMAECEELQNAIIGMIEEARCARDASGRSSASSAGSASAATAVCSPLGASGSPASPCCPDRS